MCATFIRTLIKKHSLLLLLEKTSKEHE